MYSSEEYISIHLRLKIAINISSGMDFLHSLEPPIIHRDLRRYSRKKKKFFFQLINNWINSPNIFIVSTNQNDEIVAKVGDFGLAARGKKNYQKIIKK